MITLTWLPRGLRDSLYSGEFIPHLLADALDFAFDAVEAVIDLREPLVDLPKALVDLFETAIDALAEVIEPPVCPFLDHRLHDDGTLARNVLSVVELGLGIRHSFHTNARQ